MRKLADLRDAWVKFTCPQVSALAKLLIQKAVSGLKIPEMALDLLALPEVTNTRKVKIQKARSCSLTVCPVAIFSPRKAKAKGKAKGLMELLSSHGISADAVKFVAGVHKLIPTRRIKINWALWLCASDDARRPPLWWRIFMLILESDKPFYLQMTRQSTVGSPRHSVDIVITEDHQGQIPNLDIWTWDTAAALRIFQTCLFSEAINAAALKVVKNFRNRLGHFDVEMNFTDGFACINGLLVALRKFEASFRLKKFQDKVRSWFPAFGKYELMEQARSRPLMLTRRQYHDFEKYVLGKDGHILPRCRLRFQCGASSGKTVMATLLCVEFWLDLLSPQGELPAHKDMRVLYLTHAPILARRAASDLSDQLKLKLLSMKASNQVLQRAFETVRVQHDDCDIYRVLICDQEAIVVATINATLDTLLHEIFLGGVVVDEAHAVYGADRRKGQTVGQCRLPAKEIAPIVERLGGAMDAHDGAKRLVLFGDERNQSMRRRFTDTGEGLLQCHGCGTRRLPCWMAKQFHRSFYSCVERLFNCLDLDGSGKLSKKEFLVFLKEIKMTDEMLAMFQMTSDDINESMSDEQWTNMLKKLHTTPKRGVDVEALCYLYHHDKEARTFLQHQRLYGSWKRKILSREQCESKQLCIDCELVAKAWSDGVTTQEHFLGDTQDPVFPPTNDPKHTAKSMRFVARGLLDNNYRQPAKLADMAAAQHGGQRGDMIVQHVDSDSVEGRETRYAHVTLANVDDLRKKVRRILMREVSSDRIKADMHDLTQYVCGQYIVTLAKELFDVCAYVVPKKRSSSNMEPPDILVVAPCCSDDPGFLERLKDGCVRQHSKIRQLVQSGQVRFGGVGEWTGSDCPVVVLTGFHQPYHLLTNVGCSGRECLLASSRADVDRAKALATEADKKYKSTNSGSAEEMHWCKQKEVAESKLRRLEEEHASLTVRLPVVPVDTLLYIAITRATWGLSVVEPDPKRFVQHFVIGKRGRVLSTKGIGFLAKRSFEDPAGRKAETPRYVHAGQVLSTAAKLTRLDMSGNDLILVPNAVLSMRETQFLDLSVNNLMQLPKELWTLSLCELNLSHNPLLGRVLLSALREAAQCTQLSKLLLRDVVTDGVLHRVA